MEEQLEKTKYKNLSDNLCQALSFYVFAIVLELTTSLCLFGNIPSYMYVSLIIIHLLALVIFVLPGKVFRRVVSSVLLIGQTIVSITNDILHNITGEVFTFDKFSLAGEAAGSFSISMVNFFHLFLYLAILALALFCIFGLPKFLKKFEASKKQFASILACFLFTFFAMFGAASPNYMTKNNLLLTCFPTTLAYSNFGYYGFYLSNAFLSLGSINKDVKLSNESYEEIFSYLENGSSVSANEYTGVSEGNNVILILAESFDIAAIDPYFTPNLYKMWFEDGMLLKNYHAENKTNMSEGMTLFGTYGRARPLMSNVKLVDVFEPISLPTLLKKSDESIKTSYVHSFNYSTYNRDITHPKLGFDEVVFASDQEKEIKQYNIDGNESYNWTAQSWNNYMKDSNFFEYNKELIIPSTGRFFTNYATMVTHGTYIKRGSNKDNYNKLVSAEEAVHLEEMKQNMKAFGYNINNALETFLIYKAAVMDFDEMIGKMMARLSELNILDKTTIYMYPDHNAYYDDLSYRIRNITDKDAIRECQISAYNMGACIYDQKLIKKYKGESEYNGGVIVDKFTSVNDVYPTLCNILNIKYNYNLCYGQSIFEPSDGIFISLKDDRYIFDDKFYYYNDKIYDAQTRQVVVNEDFSNRLNSLLEKFEIHEKLYKSPSSLKKMLEELGY